MKTEKNKTFMREKWSIKPCEAEKGWKLKNVRRVQVKAESLDGVKIMREIHKTNFDSKFDDRYWRVNDIYLIENDKLRSRFQEYKKELTELGRSPETVTETLAFSAETEKACKDICREGYKVGSKKRHVLGHTGSGVHLVRHYDILTRYLMYQQYPSPAYIFVYKTYLGKAKPIVPRLHKDDHYVSPYVGFDSHVSARHVDREMPICEALNCSYVYLYEFDQISSNPVKHPRQILPYVIIQLEKKIPAVPENPFLSVGSDASRSTWEVKGETRRGFRFMFTKSGLKGKHKVFSKNSMNFGSQLKEQILEMRTKSAGSVIDAKPPLLQKFDDNCKNSNTLDTGKSKPPDLQFTVMLKQTNSKADDLITCKEITIPEHLRSVKQLTNLKPCVKLKRLNSKCLYKSRAKTKYKRSVDTEQEIKKSDSDFVSKEMVLDASDFTSSKEGIQLCSSQSENKKLNETIQAEINSTNKSIQFDHMNMGTLNFNICDITKGRDNSLTFVENKSTKLFSSQKLKQNNDEEKKQKVGNVLPKCTLSKTTNTNSEIRNSQTEVSKFSHSNEKSNCVDENKIKNKEIKQIGHTDQTLSKKIVPSRCSPTKAKFGNIEYKIDENKKRQGSYPEGKIQKENSPKCLRKSPDIETKIQEYDFKDQNENQSDKQFSNAPNKTINKQLYNQDIKSSNFSEKDDKGKCSNNKTNEFSLVLSDSFTSIQNESIVSDKKSNCISEANGNGSCTVADISDTDRTKAFPTQIQSQRIVLEKSKSPVAANAAPDMLNVSPVLVSAQTSSCISDSNKDFEDNSLKDKLTSENKSSFYKTSGMTSKSDHFISEMTSLDNSSCIELIKQFPEKISQTLVVNPVIRTSFCAKDGLSSSNERTEFNTKTSGSNHQNSKPLGESNKMPSRSFKQKGKISDAMDSTKRSEAYKIKKGKSDQSVIKPNNDSKIKVNSKIKVMSKTSHTQQAKTPTSMESTLGDGSCNTNIIDAQRSGNSVSQDKKKKEINPNESTEVSAAVKKSKVKKTSSDLNVKLNYKQNTEFNKKENRKKEIVTIKNKTSLTSGNMELNKNNTRNDSMLSSKDILNHSKNDSLGTDNENNIMNKKECMFKPLDKVVKKSTTPMLEKTVPANVKTKVVATTKPSNQQIREFTVKKSLEQIHELSFSENSNNVKVDTHTADRFRSFLSSTAAVAMQHRKSVEQKTEKDETFEGQTENTVQISVSEDQVCRNAKYEVNSKQYTHAQQQKQRLQSISKDPFKDSRAHVFKSTRRDSLEIHDSDSQDTVIGGVPNSPIAPVPSFSSCNESMKENENFKPKLKALAIQGNTTYGIKQEDVDDQAHDLSGTKTVVENNSFISNKTQSETESVNHVSSTNEFQHELISPENIKTEPDDQELADKHFIPVKSIDVHHVKIEPLSANTSTTFFPKIRKELAKGTASLDAKQCRSAIVDTLKELSFVLKFLTDSNRQSHDQKEQAKAASVAKKLYTELSKDSSNQINEGKEFEDTSRHGIHLKLEKNDAAFDNLKNSSFTSDESISVPGDLNFENSSTDLGFQYDYILKSSEDEYQSANESLAQSSPIPESEPTTLVCPQPESFKPNSENSFSENIKQSLKEKHPLMDKHEKDELPILFDPYDEPDIVVLEKFGTPVIQHYLDSKICKVAKHFHTEETTADRTATIVTDSVKFVKDIKMEKENDLNRTITKIKPKQCFNFKSGILNKGLKERKNMFDLKIKETRSIASGNLKPSKNTCLPSKKMDKNKITSSESNAFANKEKNGTDEEKAQSFEGYQSETNDIMNEVYKTVCEKLSYLKENDIQENDSLFQKRYISETISKEMACESSMNPENPMLIKERQSQKVTGENEINDPSMVNPSCLKVESNKTNNKRGAILPFHTLIRLKRQQSLKYRRATWTNKRFIDYSQICPKFSSKEDKVVSSKMNNQGKTKASGNSEKHLGEIKEMCDPNHKASEVCEQVATFNESSSKREISSENLNRKRTHSDTDENANNSKKMKYSSEKCQSIDIDSNRRSRSRSSHRSSSSRQKLSQNSSNGETPKSPNYNERNFQESTNFNHRPYQRAKPYNAHFNTRGYYGNYHTRFNMSANRYGNFLGKASFNKSGTGYFSWRRKYQPKRPALDGYVVTGKGSFVPVAEYEEWSRFKERETLRDQIENAIKEYRRTFEDTPDDMKGDEKVASYLTFLTEKLDKIQSKRNKLIPQESTDNGTEKHNSKRRSSSERKASRSPQPERERSDNIFRKLEKVHNIHHQETHDRSSLARFSGSLASDSDNLSYKQRRHASGIEDLLKEHISKHYEHLTRQIKQDIDDLKSSKLESSRKDHKQSSYQKDRHRSKYDDTIKHDKYRSHSQEGYDSKRLSKGESSRLNGDYKHSGKDRYNSHRYEKHGERYPYEDKYARRQDSFRDFKPDYDSRQRDNYQYKSSYGDYRYHSDKSAYKRNYDNLNHNRSIDYRNTYEYQQNYDKYQDRFQEEHRGYKYFDVKKSCYGSNTEKTFDLREKVMNSKLNESKQWFRGKYNKYYNKGNETSDNSDDTKEDGAKDETESETRVDDEFDATKYRDLTPAFKGFKNSGRGSFRGANRFNPVYKPTYQAAKYSRFRNPPTFYFYDDKDTEKSNSVKDTHAQKCGVPVEEKSKKSD